MKSQKNLFAILGLVVGALLLAGAVFLLVRGIGAMGKKDKALTGALRTFDAYYQDNPFPSDDNVKIEKDNTQLLTEWSARLLERLAQGQVQPDERMTPSTFMRLLGDKRNALATAASNEAAGVFVDLPAGFAFGFDKYFAPGTPPPQQTDVPRLTQQLLVVERLLGILFQARVSGILGVKREEFEGGAPSTAPATPAPATPAAPPRGRSSRPAAGRPAATAPAAATRPTTGAGGVRETELYTVLGFDLVFKAREDALWQVLNALAGTEFFCAVTEVRLTRDQKDVRQIVQAAKSADASGTEPAPEEPLLAPGAARIPTIMERMMSGKDHEIPSTVTLRVDVYIFKQGAR